MKYDFDKIIDRRNTDSIKYDFAERRGMPKDILPLWVADMDFQAPKEVVAAMVEKSQHGIYGYSEGREDYFQAVFAWFQRHFDWNVKREWLLKTPGVVYAVTMAIRSMTEKGDGILIQEPVYYPFRESIEINDRKIVVNELLYSGGKYSVDLETFEKIIIEEDVKLFILCSPHNPVGRVWLPEELIAMGDICLKHNVLVVADEIHADFTYTGFKHHVFANLKEEFEKITITCTSPSKTFNLAGLQLSNVFIADRKLRRSFQKEIMKSGYSQPNIMGLVSCNAAYTHGDRWLSELREYLRSNLVFFNQFLADNIPQAKVVEPEGTYLVWVDMTNVPVFKDMTSEHLDSFMVQKAKLWLDGGTMFGSGGEGFQRFNIACPRGILEKALKQLVAAIQDSV